MPTRNNMRNAECGVVVQSLEFETGNNKATRGPLTRNELSLSQI